MKIPHMLSAGAAIVLAMAIAALAQSAPQPSPAAQANRQQETPVTLVGCLMRETEYRKANDAGKGGALGTGVGGGNEFVLVNASRITAGLPPSNSECSTASGGEAYELTGNREKELEPFVGRRVEITGMVKEAKIGQTAEGTTRPTGGFDPIRQDLKLFEVEVASFREPPSGQRAAVTPSSPAPRQAAPPPASVAPVAPPAAPQPEPRPGASTAPRETLPRTASSLPLVGLIGLVSLASGLRLRRRLFWG